MSAAETKTRLDAYKAAELRILQAQEAGQGDRRAKLAELSTVAEKIKELEAQYQAELASEAGRVGPMIAVADFSRGLGR